MSKTKIEVVIRTIDRTPKQNFLRQTLLNLAEAGAWDSPVMGDLHIVDGGSSDVSSFLAKELYPFVPHDRVTVLAADHRLTHNENGIAAVKRAASLSAKHVILLEDDVDFCAKFIDAVDAWMDDHVTPVDRLVALGANYAQINRCVRDRRSRWDYPCKAFYGAQALVVPKPWLRSLANFLEANPLYGGKVSRCHDLLIGQWGLTTGATHFLATAPSFVQHTGNDSALNNKFFTFSSWPGKGWTYERRSI